MAATLIAPALMLTGTTEAVAAPVTQGVSASAQADALTYWTPKRMREADPADIAVPGDAGSAAAKRAGQQPRSTIPYTSSEVTDPTSTENRVFGKVFFHDPVDGNNYECSGTAIHSDGQNMVSTAGHCVYAGAFVTNWVFAPGFHDGIDPFGLWAATNLTAPSGWVSSITCTPSQSFENCANFDYDIGGATTAPNSSGQLLENVVGAKLVGFDQPRDQHYQAYGYPGVPNLGVVPPQLFNGSKLWTCDSEYGGSDGRDPAGGPAPMVIGCDMTAGSSGGGWIVGNDCLQGLNSYGYPSQPARLYGPYFGEAAQNVYAQPDPTVKAKITSHPKSKSSKPKAKFKFKVANASSEELECFATSLQCKLDSKAWKDCSKGHKTYKKLGRGKHTFKVRAEVDKVGVTSKKKKFKFRVT